MQLKTLQIQGFKSFPDKTTLHFDEGITAVVGPNGSGKSNIADAMSWVMGEQSVRTLRGEKMEDVIFLGTNQRKPTGYAFVSLTFDNRDRALPMESDDVTISRKLYRSGESEYRINHAAVRLKDINELLMDTGLGRDGYSTIGQGRIDEIVSVKSNQRREIFEEAAGISKYRYRKEEAEKKLEAAYENLLRLKDIMSELEDRVEPLRIQSEKAQKFLALSEEKRILEVSFWIDSIQRLRGQLDQQESLSITARNKLQDMEAVLEEYSCRMEEAYEKVQKQSVEIEANRSRSESMTESLSQVDSAIAVLENDILHNTKSAEELRVELERSSQNRDALEQTIEKNKKEAAAGQTKLLAAVQERENLEQQETEIALILRQAGETVAVLKSKRNAYEQSIALQKLNRASSSALLEETRQRLTAMELASKNRDENLRTLTQEVEACRRFIRTVEEKEQALSNSRKGYELKRASRCRNRDSLMEQQRQWMESANKLSHQAKVLSDMERSMEGFQNSVKQVMNASRNGQLRGIHGPISQLIAAPNEYALAVETALGGSMQSVVVDHEESAKSAIQYLKYNKGGRATFLPITTIKPQFLTQKGLEKEEGFRGIAADLVESGSQYRNIVENLLGRIVVAETIDHAIAMARKYGYKFRIVTLDGQMINAGGSFTGGSLVKNAGLLSRRAEIDRLNGEAGKLEKQCRELEPELHKAKEEIAEADAMLSSLDAQMKTAGEDRITYQAEEKRLEATLEDMKRSRDTDALEYEKVKERMEEMQNTSRSSQELIAKATEELAETFTQLEKHKSRQEELAQQRQSFADQINEKRFQILSLTKDVESLKEAAAQLLRSQNQQQDQLGQLQEKKQSLEALNTQIMLEIKAKQEEKTAIQNEIRQTAQHIQELFQQQSQMEQKLTEMRGREKQYISEKERAAGEMQRLEDKRISLQMEYDKLISRLWDDYSLTRSQAEEIARPITDPLPMKGRLAELKSQIKNLGTINVAAIEEYQEVSQRYEFLRRQIDDVERSRNELIDLIRDLTSQMRELFLTNFNAIGKCFSGIFGELFGGGQGELILTDPDDVLSSGIDIKVQPPGKIIKTLSALSGGEKALVAIAIYFAILKVKPSPFCILDEIEAALDEVNVSRYARYLRKLTGKTQFISITHRRGTMEEADVMYGVTMQEKGVSRLLELDITQVESKLGLKPAEQ